MAPVMSRVMETPLEVLENIIDRVQGLADLKSLSLAAKCLRGRAQYHLLQEITLRLQHRRLGYQALHRLLSTGATGTSVWTQSMKIRGIVGLQGPPLPRLLADMATVTDLMTRLQSLTFLDLSTYPVCTCQEGLATSVVAAAGLNRIRQLILRNVILQDGMELPSAVGSLKNLSRLTLWCVSWPMTQAECEIAPPPAILENLTLFGMTEDNIYGLCKWLLHGERTIKIETLNWGVYLDCDDLSFLDLLPAWFFHIICSEAKGLVMIYGEQEYTDLRLFDALTELEFTNVDSCIDQEYVDWVVRCLRSFPGGSSFRKFDLKMQISLVDHAYLEVRPDEISWIRLLTVMSEMVRAGRLGSVTLTGLEWGRRAEIIAHWRNISSDFPPIAPQFEQLKKGSLSHGCGENLGIRLDERQKVNPESGCPQVTRYSQKQARTLDFYWGTQSR